MLLLNGFMFCFCICSLFDLALFCPGGLFNNGGISIVLGCWAICSLVVMTFYMMKTAPSTVLSYS